MIQTKPKIELNEDQTKALSTLEGWLYSSNKARDESLFAKLTGSAGTGKTTLLGVLLENVKESTQLRNHRVCVCAPTHKAKKVLKQKTNWDNSETLQALLGLRLDTNLDDFDPNNPIFNPIGDRRIKDYDFVIIDESSMINSDLYITITDCAKSTGAKVLFVGDSKQLNPVGEYSISPALITPINGYDLTQVVRQNNDNPLLILLDILRLDIENGTSNYITYMMDNRSAFNERGEGYELLNSNEFAKRLENGFNSLDFTEDKNYCRFIAWTNDSISKTNRYIRNTILKRTEELQVGDLLLGYKTISEDNFSVLVNSDDYIVEDAVKMRNPDYEIDGWMVRLLCIDTDSSSQVFIPEPNKVNHDKFTYIHQELLDIAKQQRGKAWKRFYDFRDSFILLEPIKDNQYSKEVLVAKKDIDYGYGITIHKSQGSTYNTVFVNGKDINRNFNELEKLRLWYVALSRCSHKAIINI